MLAGPSLLNNEEVSLCRRDENVYKLHFLDLSTFKPHRLATEKTMSLTYTSRGAGVTPELEVVEDLIVVGLFDAADNVMELWAIDWRGSQSLMVNDLVHV